VNRLAHIRDVSAFDVVFLYREAYPIGPPLLERWLAGPGKPPIVYDFDDAVFLPNVSDANRLIVSLKWTKKIPEILGLPERVVAGNEYLASYARRFNDSVAIIPTCVDTDKFVPRQDRAKTAASTSTASPAGTANPPGIAVPAGPMSPAGATSPLLPVVGWI